MQSWITEQPLFPWQELERYQHKLLQQEPGRVGATTVFTGTMRDFNDHDGIVGLDLEHFPGMTEKYLQKILAEADQRWELLDALIIHRIGTVKPDDCIVLVAAWSARRVAAFEAARYLIEELKSRAPFWKKEYFADGSESWVSHNTPG
ncbi:MAG TPA: molybdopterin converting factor [Gammaproteobacteria bacterium]|nr:molybdopterin converting factor [Gammaproteobacteria bacterium]